MQISASKQSDPSKRRAAPLYLIQRPRRSRDFLAIRLRSSFSFVYYQVYGHLALQTADIPVAKVVTQLVYLEKKVK